MENYMDFDPRSQAVFNAPEQPQESAAQGNSNIYRPLPENATSEDKIYRATIRIVNNVYDMRNSIVEKQTYFLKDAQGGFSADSPLSVNDRECPIFKTWKKLRYAKVEENPELVKKFADRGWPLTDDDHHTAGFIFANSIFDKSTHRFCLVQVVEDDNHPELVGKYLFWKLPSFIWESLQEKMNPSDKKKMAIPVCDWFLGNLIELVVKPGPGEPGDERWKREISYKSSEITSDIYGITRENGDSFFTEEEQEILDKYVDLVEKARKEKKQDKRDKMLAAIKENPIRVQVAELYTKAAEELKTFCPNIGEEIAFNYYDKAAGKIWNDETTARIMNFLKIAESWEKPAETDEAPDTKEPATSKNESSEPKENLPF